MSVAQFAPAAVAPGVWRWTAEHPGWEPGAQPDSPADWERSVGCLLCELDGAAVFVDALMPGDERAFWRWADERQERAERTLALTTIGFHRRSRDELVARYGASTSRARAALPAGLRSIRLPGAGEVMFWLAGSRALVAGDRVLGDGDGGLRPLLELPIERVLVSHGEPVLSGGREALAEAIG